MFALSNRFNSSLIEFVDSPNSSLKPLKYAEVSGFKKNFNKSLILVFDVINAFINALNWFTSFATSIPEKEREKRVAKLLNLIYFFIYFQKILEKKLL